MYKPPAAAPEALQYLVGDAHQALDRRPLTPYGEQALDFLSALSKALLDDPSAKPYPDVVAFAFWCRMAHLRQLKQQFAQEPVRLGLGLVFHITPANVEINFAYSFAFALLAGNANVVRVPSAHFAQVELVCRHMAALCAQPRHATLASMTAFVRYAQNDAITAEFSRQCNARMVWGGNQTIRQIAKSELPARSVELRFSDRYSFCVLAADAVLQCTPDALHKLAIGFYNDSYLTDQNACSAPHLLVWVGSDADCRNAQARFWEAVLAVVEQRYALQALVAVDKLVQACQNAIDVPQVSGLTRHGNYIYRLQLSRLDAGVTGLRGTGGLFYECSVPHFEAVTPIVNTSYQTLAYFGMDKRALQRTVVEQRLCGIDRIVPVGQTLDIGVIWDGYDIVRSLSRIVDVR